MQNLLTEQIAVVRSANATAAGTSDINGATIDLQTHQARSVAFVALLGTLTSTQVTKLKAQSSPDDSTWTDIPDAVTAAAADGDGNKLLVLDVKNVPQRYVRAVVDRGTANAVVDGVLAFPYDFRTLPTSQSSTYVSSHVKTVDPAAA